MQEEYLQDKKQEKAQLRKQILKKRNGLSHEQREIWDKQIFEELVKYDAENPCSAYLCYVNYRSEVKTKDFILWCLEMGKTVFVPKVLQKEPAEMEFYRIAAWGELKAGYQGILEPEVLPERAFSRWFTGTERARVLLPGAVFDKKGNRIGYGGGFYDRWIAKQEVKICCFDGKLEKIGLAYGMQVVEELPSERFDQKADFVITEKLMIF